jgi:sugar/nucleoside kinase (ribokinase family)
MLHNAAVHCRTDSEDCELCLKYGEKIPVERIFRSLGGNAANNAVGLKRLGLHGGFYTIHGDDEIGERIDQYLEKEHIDLSLVTCQLNTESRYSTILSFKGERTILEHQVQHKYHLMHDFPKTSWIYLSSVGKNYEDFFNAIAVHVRERKIKLVFTPNNVQLSEPVESYRAVLEYSHAFFSNKEEAAKMLNNVSGIMNSGQEVEKMGVGEIKNMLSEIYELGPKVVAITDGREGSYVYDGDKYYYLRIFDFPLVEMTGAGDAYASGFMAALMRNLPTSEAMRWGTFNAGSVVTQVGAQKGLLRYDEMKKLLKDNSDFYPEEI